MTARIFLRTIGLLTAIIHLFTSTLFAHKVELSVWSDRARVFQPASLPPAIPTVSPVSSVASVPTLSDVIASLPSSLGSVRKVRVPARKSGSRIVVHIQDVHGNPEAQINIGRVVRGLIDRRKAGLVALEGAFGPIDLERFNRFPNKAILNEVADYLLRENQISGPIQAALTAAVPGTCFVGVDDPLHYRLNVDAYLKSAPSAPQVREKNAADRILLERRKKQTFNAALLAFDERIEAFRSARVPLGEHLRFLAEDVSETDPNVRLFLDSLRIEAALNFPAVERGREALLRELLGKLTAQRSVELRRAILAFGSGKIRVAEFFLFIETLCAETRVDLTKYPSMRDYLRYVSQSDQIDADNLFERTRQLEEAGYARRVRTPVEAALVRQSRQAELVRKLTDFSLTAQEWKELAPSAELSSFKSFYAEAQARDAAMARNLLRQMDLKRTEVAVLVTGGFHSAGVDALLESAGVTTVSFVPKLTKLDLENGSAYLSAFSQQKTPLEKLFDGEKLFLAKPPLPREPGLAIGIPAGLLAAHAELPSDQRRSIRSWLPAHYRLWSSDVLGRPVGVLSTPSYVFTFLRTNFSDGKIKNITATPGSLGFLLFLNLGPVWTVALSAMLEGIAIGLFIHAFGSTPLMWGISVVGILFAHVISGVLIWHTETRNWRFAHPLQWWRGPPTDYSRWNYVSALVQATAVSSVSVFALFLFPDVSLAASILLAITPHFLINVFIAHFRAKPSLRRSLTLFGFGLLLIQSVVLGTLNIFTDPWTKSYVALNWPLAIVFDAVACLFAATYEQALSQGAADPAQWKQWKTYKWPDIFRRMKLAFIWGAILFHTIVGLPLLLSLLIQRSPSLANFLQAVQPYFFGSRALVLATMQVLFVRFVASPLVIDLVTYYIGRKAIAKKSDVEILAEAKGRLLSFSGLGIVVWTAVGLVYNTLAHSGYPQWAFLVMAITAFFWEVLEFSFIRGRDFRLPFPRFISRPFSELILLLYRRTWLIEYIHFWRIAIYGAAVILAVYLTAPTIAGDVSVHVILGGLFLFACQVYRIRLQPYFLKFIFRALPLKTALDLIDNLFEVEIVRLNNREHRPKPVGMLRTWYPSKPLMNFEVKNGGPVRRGMLVGIAHTDRNLEYQSQMIGESGKHRDFRFLKTYLDDSMRLFDEITQGDRSFRKLQKVKIQTHILNVIKGLRKNVEGLDLEFEDPTQSKIRRWLDHLDTLIIMARTGQGKKNVGEIPTLWVPRDRVKDLIAVFGEAAKSISQRLEMRALEDKMPAVLDVDLTEGRRAAGWLTNAHVAVFAPNDRRNPMVTHEKFTGYPHALLDYKSVRRGATLYVFQKNENLCYRWDGKHWMFKPGRPSAAPSFFITLVQRTKIFLWRAAQYFLPWDYLNVILDFQYDLPFVRVKPNVTVGKFISVDKGSLVRKKIVLADKSVLTRSTSVGLINLDNNKWMQSKLANEEPWHRDIRFEHTLWEDLHEMATRIEAKDPALRQFEYFRFKTHFFRIIPGLKKKLERLHVQFEKEPPALIRILDRLGIWFLFVELGLAGKRVEEVDTVFIPRDQIPFFVSVLKKMTESNDDESLLERTDRLFSDARRIRSATLPPVLVVPVKNKSNRRYAPVWIPSGNVTVLNSDGQNVFNRENYTGYADALLKDPIEPGSYLIVRAENGRSMAFEAVNYGRRGEFRYLTRSPSANAVKKETGLKIKALQRWKAGIRGGLQEIFYGGVIVIPMFFLEMDFDGQVLLVLLSVISLMIYVSRHKRTVKIWGETGLEDRPGENHQPTIIILGSAFRLIFLFLILIDPSSLICAMAAVPLFVLIHAFYDAEIAPRTGLPLGMGEPVQWFYASNATGESSVNLGLSTFGEERKLDLGVSDAGDLKRIVDEATLADLWLDGPMRVLNESIGSANYANMYDPKFRAALWPLLGAPLEISVEGFRAFSKFATIQEALMSLSELEVGDPEHTAFFASLFDDLAVLAHEMRILAILVLMRATHTLPSGRFPDSVIVNFVSMIMENFVRNAPMYDAFLIAVGRLSRLERRWFGPAMTFANGTIIWPYTLGALRANDARSLGAAEILSSRLSEKGEKKLLKASGLPKKVINDAIRHSPNEEIRRLVAYKGQGPLKKFLMRALGEKAAAVIEPHGTVYRDTLYSDGKSFEMFGVAFPATEHPLFAGKKSPIFFCCRVRQKGVLVAGLIVLPTKNGVSVFEDGIKDFPALDTLGVINFAELRVYLAENGPYEEQRLHKVNFNRAVYENAEAWVSQLHYAYAQGRHGANKVAAIKDAVDFTKRDVPTASFPAISGALRRMSLEWPLHSYAVVEAYKSKGLDIAGIYTRALKKFHGSIFLAVWELRGEMERSAAMAETPSIPTIGQVLFNLGLIPSVSAFMEIKKCAQVAESVIRAVGPDGIDAVAEFIQANASEGSKFKNPIVKDLREKFGGLPEFEKDDYILAFIRAIRLGYVDGPQIETVRALRRELKKLEEENIFLIRHVPGGATLLDMVQDDVEDPAWVAERLRTKKSVAKLQALRELLNPGSRPHRIELSRKAWPSVLTNIQHRLMRFLYPEDGAPLPSQLEVAVQLGRKASNVSLLASRAFEELLKNGLLLVLFIGGLTTFICFVPTAWEGWFLNPSISLLMFSVLIGGIAVQRGNDGAQNFYASMLDPTYIWNLLRSMRTSFPEWDYLDAEIYLLLSEVPDALPLLSLEFERSIIRAYQHPASSEPQKRFLATMLVFMNFRVLIWAAHHFTDRGEDPMDSLQNAFIFATTKALDRFQPERNTRFAKYLMWWARKGANRGRHGEKESLPDDFAAAEPRLAPDDAEFLTVVVARASRSSDVASETIPLILRHFAGESYLEIARQIGVKEVTLRQRVHRTLLMLQQTADKMLIPKKLPGAAGFWRWFETKPSSSESRGFREGMLIAFFTMVFGWTTAPSLTTWVPLSALWMGIVIVLGYGVHRLTGVIDHDGTVHWGHQNAKAAMNSLLPSLVGIPVILLGGEFFLFVGTVLLSGIHARSNQPDQEFLPVFDAAGKHTGFAERGAVHEDGADHPKVHVYVVGPDGTMLVERKTRNNRLGVLISGHINSVDMRMPNPVFAAVSREAREEARIEIDLGRLVRVSKPYEVRYAKDKDPDNDHNELLTVFVYWANAVEMEKIERGFNREEIDNVERIPAEGFLRLLTDKDKSIARSSRVLNQYKQVLSQLIDAIKERKWPFPQDQYRLLTADRPADEAQWITRWFVAIALLGALIPLAYVWLYLGMAVTAPLIVFVAPHWSRVYRRLPQQQTAQELPARWKDVALVSLGHLRFNLWPALPFLTFAYLTVMMVHSLVPFVSPLTVLLMALTIELGRKLMRDISAAHMQWNRWAWEKGCALAAKSKKNGRNFWKSGDVVRNPRELVRYTIIRIVTKEEVSRYRMVDTKGRLTDIPIDDAHAELDFVEHDKNFVYEEPTVPESSNPTLLKKTTPNADLKLRSENWRDVVTYAQGKQVPGDFLQKVFGNEGDGNVAAAKKMIDQWERAWKVWQKLIAENTTGDRFPENKFENGWKENEMGFAAVMREVNWRYALKAALGTEIREAFLRSVFGYVGEGDLNAAETMAMQWVTAYQRWRSRGMNRPFPAKEFEEGWNSKKDGLSAVIVLLPAAEAKRTPALPAVIALKEETAVVVAETKNAQHLPSLAEEHGLPIGLLEAVSLGGAGILEDFLSQWSKAKNIWMYGAVPLEIFLGGWGEDRQALQAIELEIKMRKEIPLVEATPEPEPQPAPAPAPIRKSVRRSRPLPPVSLVGLDPVEDLLPLLLRQIDPASRRKAERVYMIIVTTGKHRQSLVDIGKVVRLSHSLSTGDSLTLSMGDVSDAMLALREAADRLAKQGVSLPVFLAPTKGHSGIAPVEFTSPRKFETGA